MLPLRFGKSRRQKPLQNPRRKADERRGGFSSSRRMQRVADRHRDFGGLGIEYGVVQLVKACLGNPCRQPNFLENLIGPGKELKLALGFGLRVLLGRQLDANTVWTGQLAEHALRRIWSVHHGEMVSSFRCDRPRSCVKHGRGRFAPK
jgi:hypothetical protein